MNIPDEAVEVLPVGAQVVSAKTGESLMRTPDGWMACDPGPGCIALAGDMFDELRKTTTPPWWDNIVAFIQHKNRVDFIGPNGSTVKTMTRDEFNAWKERAK